MPISFGKSKEEDVVSLIAAKKYARAVEVLKAQLQKRGANQSLRMQLADVLILADKKQEAVTLLLPLADQYARDGFAAKAVSVLKKVQKVDPGRKDVEERLARQIEERQREAAVALPRSVGMIGIEEAGAPAPGVDADPSLEIGFESMAPISAPVATPPPVEGSAEGSLSAWEPLAALDPVVAAEDGAPPPDVRLLLDFEEAVPAGPGPSVNLDRALGPAQDEELPLELRALLDDGEEEPTLVVERAEPNDDQAMADDVAEADFYLSQGMVEEARTVLLRMQEGRPRHPAVATLAARIARVAEGPTPSPPTPPAVPAPAAPARPIPVEAPAPAETETVLPDDFGPSLQEIVPKFTVTDAPTGLAEADFVNLGAELEEELAVEDQRTTARGGGPLVDGLLKEFQKGVREQLDEKDYETHYNLGIAYKEMELYDEAIQEFRLTAREPKRALECADLVGLCYLAKGQPEKAIQDMQAGLEIGGHPPEAYHSLRYDLGTAYEKLGDLGTALEQFEILQSEGAHFRDIQARLEALRGRVGKAPRPKKANETTPRKKKISFI